MLTVDRKVDPNSVLVHERMSLSLNPAIDLTNGVLELIALDPAKCRLLAASVYTRLITSTAPISLNWVSQNGIIVPAILAIDAAPEKFKLITNTAMYTVDGVVISKAPTTANTFSAAYTVNNAGVLAQLFGAFLVQADASGTITTKACSADQTFTTLAAAIAALPAADAHKVAQGYITVKTKASTKWTANTDDMTNGSDVDTATFVSYTARPILTAAIAPLAAQIVPGVIDTTVRTTETPQKRAYSNAGDLLVVLCTSSHTAALTDARLHLRWRKRVYRGD